MTKRAKLEALLARVLAGTGPDRELDGEIERLFLPKDADAVTRSHHGWSDRVLWLEPHPYTGSLDAAMTLVLEGCAVELVQALSGSPWHATLRGGSAVVPIIGAMAATPARALIAACINAKLGALSK